MKLTSSKRRKRRDEKKEIGGEWIICFKVKLNLRSGFRGCRGRGRGFGFLCVLFIVVLCRAVLYVQYG